MFRLITYGYLGTLSTQVHKNQILSTAFYTLVQASVQVVYFPRYQSIFVSSSDLLNLEQQKYKQSK